MFQVYSVVQLALFSWQSNAIKYYRDIAANQLIPGHNTYAAYNIPSYIENYYNTSQTLFYTGRISVIIYYAGIVSTIRNITREQTLLGGKFYKNISD